MAMSSKVGTFVANTSTGNQAITGVGFQPKVVIFWGNKVKNTDSPPIGEFWEWFGVATSSTDRRVVYGAGDTAANNANGHDNSKCITVLSGTSSVRLAADFVSMDADGFTVNLTTATLGEAYEVNYMALGGADLTNVKTGQFTLSTSTGNQGITGVGFKPDCILLFTSRSTTTAPPSNTSGQNRFTLGFGTSSTNRAFLATIENLSPPVAEKTYQRTNEVYGLETDNPNSNSVLMEADLVSLDTDGFTINITTATTARYVFYLALKGGSYKVGSFNQATSTGNQGITGVGFQPTGVLFLSGGKTSQTTIQADSNLSLGAASSSTARAVIWGGGLDGSTAGTLPREQSQSVSAVILNYAPASGSATLNASADFVSNDADGFTVNWGTADATAREILYLAIGSTVSTNPQINVFDSINVSEAVTSWKSVQTTSVFDSINISEATTPQKVNTVSVFDSANVSESITASLVNNISVSDNINVSESVTTTKINYVNVFDSINVSEAITAQTPTVFANIFDSVLISENVSGNLGTPGTYNIDLFDNITVSENITASESAVTTQAIVYRHLPTRVHRIR